MWNPGNQGFVPIPDLPKQQQQSPYPAVPGYPPQTAGPGYPQTTGPGYPQPQTASYPSQHPPYQPGYPGSAPAYPHAPQPGSDPFYVQGHGTPQANWASAPTTSAYPPPPAASSFPAQPGVYPHLNTTAPYSSQDPYLANSGFPQGGSSPYPPPLGFPHPPPPGPQYPPSNPPQHQPGYAPVAGPGASGYPPPSRPENTYTNTPNYPTNLGGVHMASNMQPHEEIPTVRPSNADPLADAQALRKAMKGFGTDEAAIINVLAKRTNAERINISRAYKQSFGKDLIKDLKSELGGRLETVVLALMTPRDEYIAQVLQKAMAGLGTKERILIDVLCSATNSEIHAINAAYTRLFRTSIENDISGDTSGHFRRLLISMNTGGRAEGGSADHAMATQDAQNLLQAGVKKWGTDESAFNAVLATRSWLQLRLTFQEYEKIAGHSLEKAIKNEFSGDVERGMLAIVKCAKNRAQYFAERLHDSMVGFGTKDDDLIFLIVTRSEVDLESIKQEYQRLYNKSLAATVSGDTSGDYKKILLALVG